MKLGSESILLMLRTTGIGAVLIWDRVLSYPFMIIILDVCCTTTVT
jgi:hypothetical protein